MIFKLVSGDKKETIAQVKASTLCDSFKQAEKEANKYLKKNKLKDGSFYILVKDSPVDYFYIEEGLVEEHGTITSGSVYGYYRYAFKNKELSDKEAKDLTKAYIQGYNAAKALTNKEER